jgi:hypothetical protein
MANLEITNLEALLPSRGWPAIHALAWSVAMEMGMGAAGDGVSALNSSAKIPNRRRSRNLGGPAMAVSFYSHAGPRSMI